MISRTSTQVIKAFVELAKLDKGEFLGAGAIAQTTMSPRNYLGKMLQAMASKGLLVSQKGTGGGFRLARPASKITLYDIVEPIDNVTLWSECALGMKRCRDNNPCVIHHSWKAVREVYYDFLKNTKISDLLQ